MEVFEIGGSYVRFNDDMCDYISIRKLFQHSAFYVVGDFIKNIQNVTNFDEIYERYYKIALEIICDGIRDIGMDVLEAFEVTWYSPNDVVMGYWDFVYDTEGMKALDAFMEYKNIIDNAADELALKRALERGSRSRWQGGGFGIKGALKGAIQAGMLNIGTDAIRKVGDSIVDSNDRVTIRLFKEKVVKEQLAIKPLICGLNILYLDIASYIYNLLVVERCVYPVDFADDGTIALEEELRRTSQKICEKILSRYDNGEYDKEKAIQLHCGILEKYPYTYSALENIVKIDKSTRNEINNLCDFLHYPKI